MIKIYGIPNCGSVKKAFDFLKNNGFEYEFTDFKKQKPTIEQIKGWSETVGMDKLFNVKSTTYKKTGLNYKTLGENEKEEALSKEPGMIKRPVIEGANGVIVGFDEDLYRSFFGL